METQGCAARNVHGFKVEDIQKMAEQWEEAPSLYLQLDIQVCHLFPACYLGQDYCMQRHELTLQ